MNRTKAREEVFILVFEQSFSGSNALELFELATTCRELVIDDFIKSQVCGILDNSESIEELIKENIKGWKIDRISKVCYSILKMAIYEINFCEDIPVSVSINEAVEIAKKYGGDDDSAYINGVLGTIARAEPTCDESADNNND